MDNRMLDKEIAERFLNWHDVQWESVGNNQVLRGWQPPGHHRRSGVPYYASDPKANALVLDELERRGWWYRLQNVGYPPEPIEFKVIRDREYVGHAYATTRYRAICLAVLLAIETEKPE